MSSQTPPPLQAVKHIFRRFVKREMNVSKNQFRVSTFMGICHSGELYMRWTVGTIRVEFTLNPTPSFAGK